MKPSHSGLFLGHSRGFLRLEILLETAFFGSRQQVLVLHVSRTAWSLFASSFILHRFSLSHFILFFLSSFSFTHLQSLSQNIQTSDGIHSQHKQMNILQTITSNGGALQVIQAQTVQKSSSRRAITSTTYSSSFSSNFTNGVGHGSFSSGHPMNNDLLVRLISVFCDCLIDLHLFPSHTHTYTQTYGARSKNQSQLIVHQPTSNFIASPWNSTSLEGLTLVTNITSHGWYFVSINRQHLES